MNYEKKYKEALEKAKDFYKGYKQRDNQLYANDLETIFPELRESEDEQIRQKFIKLVKMSNEVGGFALHKWEADEMLAWLEKQGTSYTKRDVDDAFVEGMAFAKHELEKQGKQKPADKIEPKFHEGEWIISNDKKSTYQVIEVKRGIYVIRDNVDNHEYHIGIEECEKSGRLFTIQDAKDGDVLYSHEHNLLWIYKNKEECHVAINLNYTNSISFGTDIVIPSDICPATKEQRDLLFQKMKEAGYEWSEETHELKKISQRMVSAEAKEALYDEPTDEEMKELLRTEYEKGRADGIAEIKSSWSEEDETNLTNTIIMLKEGASHHFTNFSIVPCVDWLKQLKQRMGG